MENKLKIILSVVIVALAGLLMALKGPFNKDDKTSTPEAGIGSVTDEEEVIKKTVTIEGIKEEVEYIKLKSSYGFTFIYDSNYLTRENPTKGYVFVNENDENIYIKIEKINEKDNKKLKSKEVVDDYLIKRYYKTNKEDYYLITTSYPNDSEYEEGLGSRIYDMVDSFEFNK